MTRPASGWYAMAARLTRWWVRRYTRRLPTSVQAARQAEIDADLWDHWHDHAAEGRSFAVALEVVGRLVLGIPADLAWRHAQKRGAAMEPEPLTTADAARILGLTRRQVVELTTTVPDLPTPASAPRGGHLWPRARVEAWVAAHPDRGPRHPGPQLFEVGGRSPQVRTVLDLATAHAQAHHCPAVGPDDLLDGLVHPDCPGAARAVLASFGITAEQRRHARERSVADPYEPGTGRVTLPPATQLVLERAHLEAVLLADTEVTSEHVLLALASHWARSPVAVASFRRRGMDLSEVRKRVLDLTEGVALPPPPNQPPRPKPMRRCARSRAGSTWRRPPTARTHAAACPGARWSSPTPTATGSSAPTGRRCGNTSSTATATRCSPPTGGRCTWSTTKPGNGCWTLTAAR
jgi:hypothetical protein